ncbi:MAG TPA: PEP-CTERM sorting domain-containing protein [Chitinispirillaceae bacterium]|nr:PEP-CTERM sorting domain-containing protein [Chitinispirillaceae bacterium]
MTKCLLSSIAVLTLSFSVMSTPITFESTAGDQDFAASRSSFDVATNFDYYVFKEGSREEGQATNSKGRIDWNYILPNEIESAFAGSVSIRAWDIDPSDLVQVYFDFGSGNRVYAGLLQGTNGGNIDTWERAVSNGSTSTLGGWSTTTFALSQPALASLGGTSGFTLSLNVIEEALSWAAVLDYATLSLTYEPGESNPEFNVPEPATLSLFGLGLLGLAGMRSIRRRK